jgi:hypothetical protein
VYEFRCPKDNCNVAYVGHTSCILDKRIKKHKYSTSSIYKHITTDHPDNNEYPDNYLECFNIVHKFNNIIELKIVEAITIRERNPYINIKYNEMSGFLNLYK